MKGEHTPTIIQLILSTDLVVIQLKNSHLFFIFVGSQQILILAFFIHSLSLLVMDLIVFVIIFESRV